MWDLSQYLIRVDFENEHAATLQFIKVLLDKISNFNITYQCIRQNINEISFVKEVLL